MKDKAEHMWKELCEQAAKVYIKIYLMNKINTTLVEFKHNTKQIIQKYVSCWTGSYKADTDGSIRTNQDIVQSGQNF